MSFGITTGLLTMGNRFSALTLNQLSKNLGLRQRVALSQLPLTVVIFVIAASAPVLHPGLLENSAFQLSLVLYAALLVLCLAVRWERLRPGSYLVIPFADFLAIGLSRQGAIETLPGLGLLAIFPVIWLSASGVMSRTSVIVSFGGPWLIVLTPVLTRVPEATAADIAGTLLLPVGMLAIALSIRFASSNLVLQQTELEKKDTKLRGLLSASNERERLMRTMLDTVSAGVVAVNATGEYILTNHQQHLFQQLATPDNESGTGESQLLVFEQDKTTPVPAEKRPLQRAIDGETYSGYLVWLGEGPGQQAVSVAARAFTDTAGKFAGSVIVFNDVTELVEAISMKDEFVSNVSHEFRSPLTSILGYVDLVLDDGAPLPTHIKEYLEAAERNVDRLLSLVSDLLLTASPSMSVQPRPTNLSDLVKSSIGSARAHTAKAGITIIDEVPRPFWACADPLRMGQVLDNLLSNAIKYSPGGGLVTVRAQETGECAELEVQDTGMGMTEADATQVFSRFFRTSEARQAVIPGVGLGLAITKRIVESHGGTIYCVSAPGTGTTFTVRLPKNPSPAEHLLQEKPLMD